MKAYMVVLGDWGNKHHSRMLDRMETIGQLLKLLESVYVLTLHEETNMENMEDVRNYIAGEEFGYCIVTTIDSRFSCAWSLSPEKSLSFGNIVKELQNEKK